MSGPSYDSAIYEGRVRHTRYGPGPAHEFSYPATMPLLFLDEVDDIFGRHPLASARHAAPVRFRRSDFLGDASHPLDESARQLVSQRLGREPSGRVALLAHVRTWGWLFNPISLYFCFNAADGAAEALVAEVENTPWHQRHSYVTGPPGHYQLAKQLHVSPFLPMDVSYDLSYTAIGTRFAMRMDVNRQGQRLFRATLSLARRELTTATFTRLAWSRGALSHLVSGGIYWQAAHLARRRTPFYTHPEQRASEEAA